MKKVKVLVASVLFCVMGYIGASAYEKMTTTEAEEFMKANVEALTNGEGGSGSAYYPERDSEVRSCLMYVYTKGSSVLHSGARQFGLIADGYTEVVITGLYDICPRSGFGCTPYPCRF